MSPNFVTIWADGIGTHKLDPDDAASVLLSVVDALGDDLLERGITVSDEKVPWKASMAMIGGNTSWDDAAREGVQMINDIVKKYPYGTRIILLGYSGGCKVIHDWLDRADSYTLSTVAAVGFLSDPFRPGTRYQSGTPDPGGHGIAGWRGTPIDGRAFWTSYFMDVISSCPPDSPLRTLADVSDKIPGSFIEDFGDHVRLGNWQLATYIGMWRKDPLGYFRSLGPRLDAARIGVEKYLTGSHTTAYTRPFETRLDGKVDKRSLATRLAHTISYKVRRDLEENL